MRCDTCQQESLVVMRVVVARGYDRSLARPLFNCQACFERKEQAKTGVTAGSTGSELGSTGSALGSDPMGSDPKTGER